MQRSAEYAHEQLQALTTALESGAFVQIRSILADMSPADIAHLVESLPHRDRPLLWQLVDKSDEAEVLNLLSEEIRGAFFRRMDVEEILEFLDSLEIDDVADILQELPHKVTRQVLDSMDEQNRMRLQAVLLYPDDTAGGLMNIDTVTIRPDITLDVVLRYLRRHTEIPDTTDTLLVVNRAGEYKGSLLLTTLLVSDPSLTVRQAMNTNIEAILADTKAHEVANLFERHSWVTAPVTDENNILLGRITIDDVVDVIREEADHSLMSMAGLDEFEDTFAPVIKTTKRRSVWLGINLLTAILASSVIGIFQENIEKVVALAILMPIVASMGGIAGNQTLTLVIRGMALGKVGPANTRWLLTRELGVGILNGLAWALVTAVVAALWFDDITIGWIIAVAMMLTQVVATVSGAALPLLLKKMSIDPALAGSVILTTLTDVFGFMSFLGLAALIYT